MPQFLAVLCCTCSENAYVDAWHAAPARRLLCRRGSAGAGGEQSSSSPCVPLLPAAGSAVRRCAVCRSVACCSRERQASSSVAVVTTCWRRRHRVLTTAASSCACTSRSLASPCTVRGEGQAQEHWLPTCLLSARSLLPVPSEVPLYRPCCTSSTGERAATSRSAGAWQSNRETRDDEATGHCQWRQAAAGRCSKATTHSMGRLSARLPGAGSGSRQRCLSRPACPRGAARRDSLPARQWSTSPASCCSMVAECTCSFLVCGESSTSMWLPAVWGKGREGGQAPGTRHRAVQVSRGDSVGLCMARLR